MPQPKLRVEKPTRWAASRASLDTRLGRLLRRRRTLPEPAPGERIYAVGDVHGRLDLLRRLLRTLGTDAAGRTQSVARLVFLGDLIDRGPHSRQVLELVRRLQRRNPERILALAGNHEDLLLASARGVAGAQAAWLRNGGEATLRSYRLDPSEFISLAPTERGRRLQQALGTEMLAWLATLPVCWRSGDYFFCHAGVRPGVALKHQRREDLLWIRRAFLDSERAHGAVIVHGHSETDEVEIASNRINVDTAAHRSGELTAVGLQGPCRWLLSTARGYLSRGDLEAARSWNAGRRDELLPPALRAQVCTESAAQSGRMAEYRYTSRPQAYLTPFRFRTIARETAHCTGSARDIV
jgi:serine/threonine protein phosphatase 1